MECKLGLVIVFVGAVLLRVTEAGDLHSALNDYELLHHASFRHRIHKRDLYSRDPDVREVEYDSFGRHFHLVLKKSQAVLANDFQVIAVNGDNVERIVDIRPAIYHGFLADEPDSSVASAFWEDGDTFSATIQTSSDIFAVEPSWRHVPQSSNDSVISYRGSDLRMDKDFGKSFCGYADIDNELSDISNVGYEENVLSHSKGSRHRRAASPCSQSKPQPVCTLLLVADYRFFRGMGGRNIRRTTSYLMTQIDFINTIYNNTVFGACGSGFGFQIQAIKIYEAPTPPGEHGHFNMQNDDWNTNTLLELFSREPANEHYCLAHLFTHIAFDNGVLGLAYRAAAARYSLGGICSPAWRKSDALLYVNTGWTSSLSRGNNKLLSLQAQLVTAHEFGHNWGSGHDPDSSECSPSTSSGGKFVMYAYSVSGMNSNNKLFSPCSRRSIGAVLEVKADSCFKQHDLAFCGNWRVEGDEECDAGRNGSTCCSMLCRFKSGAICSDTSDACCRSCQFAPSDVVCRSVQESVCSKDSKCSGSSKHCPQPAPQPDGTSCLQKGHCRGGRCLSLCEYNGLQSCVCDTVEDSCKWCCHGPAGSNTTCSPYGNNLLPEGMPCIQGYCSKRGKCEKRIQDSIPRLWHIIDDWTPNSFVMFLRANIVGTIIVLSLILWIPICVIIYVIDKRAKDQNRGDLDWLLAQGDHGDEFRSPLSDSGVLFEEPASRF